MKSKAYYPITVSRNDFQPVIFYKDGLSALLQKMDYGLCGFDFENENVSPFDIYGNPNNRAVACLLEKGYKGVPITNETRGDWYRRNTKRAQINSDASACGTIPKGSQTQIPIRKVLSIAVCMEKQGYKTRLIYRGDRGYPIALR